MIYLIIKEKQKKNKKINCFSNIVAETCLATFYKHVNKHVSNVVNKNIANLNKKNNIRILI